MALGIGDGLDASLGFAEETAARTVADGVTTSGNPNITSATAVFTQYDLGKVVTGTGVPANTTIITVSSATAAAMSANATATGTGVSLTFTNPNGAYGTYTPPTRWIPFDTEIVKLVKNTVQGAGLRSGARFNRAAERFISTRQAKGPVTMDLFSTGLGLLLKHLLGGAPTVTTTGSGPTQWTLMTFTAGPSTAPLTGKSLTMQIGKPSDSDGTVNPFTYVGTKIISAEFSIADNQLFKVAWEFDCKDEQTPGGTGPALVTPTYSASGGAFSFLSAGLTLNGANVAAVTKATVKVTNPSAVDRFFIGQGGLKAEPIGNAKVMVGGTLEAEFTTRAALYDAFSSDANLALVLSAGGTQTQIGSSGHYYGWSASVPLIKLDGDSPTVGGPDILKMTAPFTGLDNDSGTVIQMTYTTSDTAI